MNIVIIEDEKTKRITMRDALVKAGFDTEAFASPLVALKYIGENDIDVIITDIRMPEIDGFEVLQKVKEKKSSTAVIMITAYGTIESAVEAMKNGAYDYITKPFSSEQLLLKVMKLQRIKDLEEENSNLKKQLEERYSFQNLVGKSKVMQDLYEQIELVSENDMSVLIEGESGTGKEVVASAIHYNSNRKDGPFIKLSCAALNESLFESELFGHEKGAFTGAYKSKKGKFELADKGTLFLDDVDDIPLSSQVKLLRFLQERELERVGGITQIKVDVRVICATKIDLWEFVKLNKFREDLYYRLRVIPIKLPLLKDRCEDIPMLIEHFLKKMGKADYVFTPAVIELLSKYNWPGNIRQLENAIYRIVSLARGKTISKEIIPKDIVCNEKKYQDSPYKDKSKIILEELIHNVEKDAIQWALNKANENQTQAAELLSIKRTTLRDKMRKYNII